MSNLNYEQLGKLWHANPCGSGVVKEVCVWLCVCLGLFVYCVCMCVCLGLFVYCVCMCVSVHEFMCMSVYTCVVLVSSVT